MKNVFKRAKQQKNMPFPSFFSTNKKSIITVSIDFDKGCIKSNRVFSDFYWVVCLVAVLNGFIKCIPYSSVWTRCRRVLRSCPCVCNKKGIYCCCSVFSWLFYLLPFYFPFISLACAGSEENFHFFLLLHLLHWLDEIYYLFFEHSSFLQVHISKK